MGWVLFFLRLPSEGSRRIFAEAEVKIPSLHLFVIPFEKKRERKKEEEREEGIYPCAATSVADAAGPHRGLFLS